MNELERAAYDDGHVGTPYAAERDLLRRVLEEVELPPQELERQWGRLTRRGRPWGRLAVAAAVVVCGAVLWISGARTGSGTPAAPQEASSIAARVDDEVITWAEVDATLKNVKGATAELRRQTLRQLVERNLVLQAARRMGIAVSEEEIDEAIRKDVELHGEEDHAKRLRLRGITAAANRTERREAILSRKVRARLELEKRLEGRNGFRTALLRGVRLEPADLFEED